MNATRRGTGSQSGVRPLTLPTQGTTAPQAKPRSPRALRPSLYPAIIVESLDECQGLCGGGERLPLTGWGRPVSVPMEIPLST